MNDTLKAVATASFVAGIILTGIFLPAEKELQYIFISLLSAMWVLPPVKAALKSMLTPNG